MGGPNTHAPPEYTAPSCPSSGLSTGAKAGVGVGVVVGILVLAGLLWFAYTMGKRRARAAPSEPPVYDSVVHEQRRQSNGTLDSFGSVKPIEKPSANEKARDTGKYPASGSKV